VLIGAGGVSTAEDDAYAKIRFGASPVQHLTTLIYQGPGVVRKITLGLARLPARDGAKHVTEAVGVDAVQGDVPLVFAPEPNTSTSVRPGARSVLGPAAARFRGVFANIFSG
jgi:hypothetical protein